jgi:hypothetical protein
VATAQLNAAVVGSVTSLDTVANPTNLSDSTVGSHFSAAILAAKGVVAALVGGAPKVKVIITGYSDTSPSPAGSGRVASRLKIEATEVWL